MDDTLLTDNWALAVAVIVFSLAVIVIIAGVMRRTARGQLRRVRADLRKALQTQCKAASIAEKLQRRLAKLGANAEKVKPSDRTFVEDASF